MNSETKSKIEAHIRKHRKAGGRAESPKDGVDAPEKDLKSKPERRNNAPKVEAAAEKKEVGRAEGGRAHAHAGRKSRASGGSCEANPFTSALRGSAPSGRKTMSESKGLNH